MRRSPRSPSVDIDIDAFLPKVFKHLRSKALEALRRFLISFFETDSLRKHTDVYPDNQEDGVNNDGTAPERPTVDGVSLLALLV